MKAHCTCVRSWSYRRPILWSLGLLWLVVALAWGAECTNAVAWDYEPDPHVGLFRVYVCQTSGGYVFGKPFYQDPCGYRAIEPSPAGRDTDMLCSKLRLGSDPVYAVVTAVALNGQEESEPSNEILIGADEEAPGPTPPPEPPRPSPGPPVKPPLLPPPPTLPPAPVVKGPSHGPTPTSGGGDGGISSSCKWDGSCPSSR